MTIPHCHTCAHVKRVVLWLKGRDDSPEKQVREVCNHMTGPHAMNEFCNWRAPKTEGVTE